MYAILIASASGLLFTASLFFGTGWKHHQPRSHSLYAGRTFSWHFRIWHCRYSTISDILAMVRGVQASRGGRAGASISAAHGGYDAFAATA